MQRRQMGRAGADQPDTDSRRLVNHEGWAGTPRASAQRRPQTSVSLSPRAINGLPETLV
jgi:hypothetical protein